MKKRRIFLNAYRLWVNPLGKPDEPLTLSGDTMGVIDQIDKQLLDAKNLLRNLMVKGNDGKERDTLQSMQVMRLEADVANGVFWGVVECGPRGSRSRIRRPDGTAVKKDYDDADCEEFYFRFELPATEKVGILICQRIGVRTAASTLLSFLKKHFHSLDHTFGHVTLTDKRKFDAYTNGTVERIRCRYKRKQHDPRAIIHNLRVYGRPVPKRGSVDLVINLGIPMWQKLMTTIESWSDPSAAEALVELNDLPGDPDNIDVWVEDAVTRQPKRLNAANAAELAVAEDVTDEVKRDETGEPLIDSLNEIAAALGERLRLQLAQRS